MKQTIVWHVRCLANSQFSAQRMRIERDFLTRKLEALEAENQFYALQVREAIAAKKSAFDRDRWRVKRQKKGGEQ